MKDTTKSRFTIKISQFFQLPLNIKLVKILPFPLLRIYIYMIGILYFTVAHHHALKIGKCLNYILKPSSRHPYRYLECLKAYGGIFEHYYEKLLLGYKPLNTMADYLGKRLHPTFPKDFIKRIENGQGCILVTAHFGAVEFLPLAAGIQKIKIAMIVRFKTQQLRESLLEKASHFDIFVIDADKPNVIKKAIKALKDGQVLITECDEFSQWLPNENLTLSVFGHQFPADRTLDFFYKKAKVPAFLGLMKRENGNYRLLVEPLADGNPRVSLAKKAWGKLEGYILKDPHQWYQWKSAYSFLEEHILQGHPQKNSSLGRILPNSHSSV